MPTPWIPPNSEYPPPKPGEPPLHGAARIGDHTTIRSCVDEGADIDAVFDMGLDPGAYPKPATPLMVAAGSGDGATIKTVQLLLALGADPTKAAGDESAATMACAGLGWNYRPGGDADRLRLLLDKGAPLPQKPSAANSLLCDTARTGDSALLEVLLGHGLLANGHWDPEKAKVSHRRMMNHEAEFRASEPDIFGDMPDELRDAMSDSINELNAHMLRKMSSAPSSFEIPLFSAAESGSSECVRLLLDAGAALDTRDSSHRTAMYYAASDAVVRTLLNAGLPIEDCDKFGWTPLVNALSDGEKGIPIVRALIANGADVNGTHDPGYTVFMSAVGSMERDAIVLRALVEAGADAHVVTELGYNAFHAALDVNGEANEEASVHATLEYLKELGVDIEHRNNQGQTPLARAIDDGTGTEVRVLCQLGADPNAVCPMLQCSEEVCEAIALPLLIAAADGTGVDKDQKVAALLRAGANPLVKDAQGCTPLMRVVAALCSDADDYEPTYQRFFNGLTELRLTVAAVPEDQRAFISKATPVLEGYVRRFADHIPIEKACEYDTQWREERVKCITLLAAHEGWARWQHRSQ